MCLGTGSSFATLAGFDRISAHKKHLGFTPSSVGLEPFLKKLEMYATTRAGILKIPYDLPLADALIREIAEARVQAVREREDDSFW